MSALSEQPAVILASAKKHARFMLLLVLGVPCVYHYYLTNEVTSMDCFLRTRNEKLLSDNGIQISSNLAEDHQSRYATNYLTLEVSFVAILSMQRSSSTSFLDDVLKGDDPCFTSLNEIFQVYANQSGDAWAVEGKTLSRPVTQLAPRELVAFVVRVAKRRCIEQQTLNNSLATCNGRCIVGFKEFQEHLTFDQHEWVWRHTPNLTAVVLERDVESRWKSKWVASETGDWNVKGDAEHKKKIESMNVPSVETYFREIHEDWYRFIRKTIPATDRVEIIFDDIILDDGKVARSKVLQYIGQNKSKRILSAETGHDCPP